MIYDDTVWQGVAITNSYLEGVRGAIPLAHEQLDMMLRLLKAAQPNLDSVLDLGCGDGVLGQAVLGEFPEATAVFVDFSQPMLDAAHQRLGNQPNITIQKLDYGDPAWVQHLATQQFSAIVSGYSIHHQPDERKKGIYQEIFDLLKPGGLFINMEHVASPTHWLEEQFETLFVDSLCAYQQKIGSGLSRAEVADQFYGRPDKSANILAPVTDQCDWLRKVGFLHVDTYFKVYELAVFGGIKPDGTSKK